MLERTTKPLHIDLELKRKIKFVCEFCNVTPTIIDGSVRTLETTNINYIEPHRIEIKDVTLLAFNYSDDLYVENFEKKIKLNDLEDFIKSL